MYDPTFDAYRQYLLTNSGCAWEAEVSAARQDLLEDMVTNPDYHCDTLRNGANQPLLLTRGGEQHSYNVICRPGDELFAGDIIDAFGQKWIVMEARADSTTHKTGIMYQCNKLFRFQNFTADIVERWGRIDISGYSSAFNSDTQMQHSSEQVAIYLPYDADTAKIYVDKRLPSHIGYDQFGQEILFSFRITGTNPVSESYNCGDHLLMLKAERYLHAQDKDNLELEICDYIEPGEPQTEPPVVPAVMHCEILGGKTIRIGSTRTYQAVFRNEDGTIVDGVAPTWAVSGSQVTVNDAELGIKVSVEDLADLIGDEITITAAHDGGQSDTAEIRVEVIGIV